jgi:hypothetical protein
MTIPYRQHDSVFVYYEIIINRGIIIFVDFVVHLNYEN